MITYEFVFQDCTRMTGEGADAVEALLDAYHRNGFLPNCKLVAKVGGEPVLPPQPPQEIDPGIDISTGKPPRKARR